MRKIIGIVISIVFLALALYKANFAEIGRVLIGVKLDWLILAILLYPISFIPRAIRWRRLLQPVKFLEIKSIFPVLIVGYMANNILPLRMGELFRAHFLKEREGVSGFSSIATILVERTLDGLTLVLVLAAVLVFYPQEEWVNDLGWTAGTVFFSVLMGIFLLKRYEGSKRMESIISRLKDRFLGKWLTTKFEAFLIGLRGLSSLKDLVLVGLLSILIWFIEGVTLYVITVAFALRISPEEIALLLVIVTISTMIPSGPGFIGTFQYAYVLAFALFGINKDIAIAASIITQLVFFIIVNPVGIGILLKHNLSLRGAEEAVVRFDDSSKQGRGL
jgi:glycosyltransferase 2 family protein